MKTSIIISKKDRLRIVNALKTGIVPGTIREQIQYKLNNAHVKPTDAIPGTVITMRSRVRIVNKTNDTPIEISLVYPREANLADKKISILSPLGISLLGCEKGQEISVNTPAGEQRYFIAELIYQPESAGTDE